jgi:hypothetical protein
MAWRATPSWHGEPRHAADAADKCCHRISRKPRENKALLLKNQDGKSSNPLKAVSGLPVLVW